MREKVGKSRNTVFFQWFGAPEGRKVGSLKRRVRSQLATGAMKNCTPLWREAHFEVKSVKNWRSRTTFGSWDVEKVHAVVARSYFHLKMYKTPQLRATFGSCDVEKVHAVVARSTFPSQNVQNTSAPDHFWKLRCWKSVEKVHAVVARSTFPSQNVQNTPFSDHFWRFRCRKSVEKVHAVVARSTFRSQKCKKLRVLSLFWREDVEKVDTD